LNKRKRLIEMAENYIYTIMKKESLANSIYLMDVKAPRVAKNCYPGQFVIVKMDEKGERIPLTICDYDREAGTVSIVFQALGSSTQLMAQYEEGEAFRDFTGPLGHKSELIDLQREELVNKKILFVAGGVGAAPVYPQVKWMKENGYDVDCIIGGRNKDLIILEEEMKNVAKNLYITTDDGSYGLKGNVNDCIKDLVNNQGKQYDLIIAIGPMIMMKFVCILTKELGIRTIVSMNPVMVDGTGMCGACRLTIGNEVKFACVDGPEFDGHLVNFDEAMKRLQMYKSEEGKIVLREKEGATHHHPGCECHEK
jgi:ferredoxin--NADP+ reductase